MIPRRKKRSNSLKNCSFSSPFKTKASRGPKNKTTIKKKGKRLERRREVMGRDHRMPKQARVSSNGRSDRAKITATEYAADPIAETILHFIVIG
mmetsp:Transcript_8948/g.13562  ORF Transcript_8948/g.13562 Transcript_8948/m.13562 type:complete len:94 (+) Transcript_8948:381-662(+)